MEPTVPGDVTTNSLNEKESSNFNEVYLVSTILAVFAVIGTAGNAIVVYVFNSKKDNAVSTFFILTLALVDFATCLIVIPYVIFMLNVEFKISSDFICKTGAFLLFASLLFSAFVMVAIAIDRYFCICHPLKCIMTVPRAKFLVICLAVIAFAIGVCISLMYGVNEYAPGNVTYKEGENFVSTEGRKETTPGTYQSGIYGNSSVSSAGVNPVSDLTETWSAERRHSKNCTMSEIIFGKEFQTVFFNFHSAIFLFCFLAVLVLYILIYRSVLLQRKTRSRLQKKGRVSFGRTTQTSIDASCRHSSIVSAVEVSPGASTAHSPSPDDGVLDSSSLNTSPRQIGEGSSPFPAASAALRAANLKTAAMLFVVTLVFALSYLPTELMAYDLIPYNGTLFYMYFVNSVANPIIYSFMNRNFREKVKMLISGRCRR